MEPACIYVYCGHLQVREAVVILDLDVIYYPCPKGGPTWRPKATEEGGRAMFPYLQDPNTGACLEQPNASSPANIQPPASHMQVDKPMQVCISITMPGDCCAAADQRLPCCQPTGPTHT